MARLVRYRLKTEFGYYKKVDGKPDWVQRPEDAQTFDSKHKVKDLIGFFEGNVKESMIESVPDVTASKVQKVEAKQKEDEAAVAAARGEKKAAAGSPNPKRAKRGYDVFIEALQTPIKRSDLIAKMGKAALRPEAMEDLPCPRSASPSPRLGADTSCETG